MPSEIWIERQIATFDRCDPSILTWDATPGAKPPPGVPTDCLQLDFDAPEESPQRWWRRLASVQDGNVCGPAPDERRVLTRALQASRPDVVLCHFGPVALRLLPIAEQAGIPVVVHFHGNDISSSLRNNRYYRWSLKRSIRRFAAAIVVGSHQRQILRSFGLPEERIALLPCGAPTHCFTTKANYRTDRCRFITVSRLVEWKGVEYTLRAFAQARQQRPDLQLHVVGNGPLQENLIRLARELTGPHDVVFHGSKEPGDVCALLMASDVFVQHSLDHESGWTEGFGVSIAEASACGLPVVVTDSGGIPDQVTDGENGFIAPQRDIARLSELMLLLAGDEALRERLGRAGRKRVIRSFDSRVLARQLEDRLLEIAAR